MRHAFAASIVACAAACSGSSPALTDAPASPSAEAVLTTEAPATKPSDVHVSALVTRVKKLASDGSVEDGELAEAEPYVAAIEAHLAALEKCPFKGEISLSLKLRPNGELATVDELDPIDACVTSAVRAAKFPSAPTETIVLIVVSRSGGPTP